MPSLVVRSHCMCRCGFWAMPAKRVCQSLHSKKTSSRTALWNTVGKKFEKKKVDVLIPHLELTFSVSVNFSHTKLVKKNFHTKSKPKHSKRRQEERKYCLAKSSSLSHIVVFSILYCVFSYIHLPFWQINVCFQVCWNVEFIYIVDILHFIFRKVHED